MKMRLRTTVSVTLMLLGINSCQLIPFPPSEAQSSNFKITDLDGNKLDEAPGGQLIKLISPIFKSLNNKGELLTEGKIVIDSIEVSGAVVGGITGIGDKNVNKSVSGLDNILTLSFQDEGKEVLLPFDCSNKKEKTVLAFFKKNYPDKFKKEVPVEIKENKEVSKISTADELLKLKGLLDAGVLTQDEFDSQKKKLLE